MKTNLRALRRLLKIARSEKSAVFSRSIEKLFQSALTASSSTMLMVCAKTVIMLRVALSQQLNASTKTAPSMLRVCARIAILVSTIKRREAARRFKMKRRMQMFNSSHLFNNESEGQPYKSAVVTVFNKSLSHPSFE